MGDGTYEVADYPNQDLIKQARKTYLGGQTYAVDSTEAAALVAAGFDVTVDADVFTPFFKGSF